MSLPGVRAWPPGCDPVAVARTVAAAHEEFVATGHAAPGLRRVVLESWRRSRRSGLRTDDAPPPIALAGDALAHHRRNHPLAAAMPLIRRLLVDDAGEAGLLVAMSDAAGRLLWVEGPPVLVERAAGMNFVPGASWDEDHAGTNAPGLALAVDAPVQVYATEHYQRRVQPWSCSAAPIHHPRTGELLGALDITGGDQVAAPHVLALVRATAAAVEGDLLRAPLPADEPVADRVGLSVLGPGTSRLTVAGRVFGLSLRHAEVLLLLSESPDGVPAEVLGAGLHPDGLSGVTVRAEVSRLRALRTGLEVLSAPYRLRTPLATDAARVRGLLRRGALDAALDAYPGPLLPRSQAPAVAELRADLAAHLRAAVLAAGRPGVLLRYARRPDAAWDLEAWSAVADVAGDGDPARAEALGHLTRLRAGDAAEARRGATLLQRRRT